MTPVALAIDIGGTKTAVAAVAPGGKLLLRQTAPTPASAGPQAILDTVVALSRQVLQHTQLQVVAAGVGSAGHVDYSRGRISYASGTLPGWSGLALRSELESRLGLPVAAENDVNALALGEAHFGAGRGVNDGLYIAVGTGIGGALICNGRLQRGASWTAGEIGHLVIDWDGRRRCPCGQAGHLEAYAAGPAMATRYQELSQIEEALDLRAIADRARAGDTYARQAIAEGAHILGLALGGLLNVLDPQVLVIGGGISDLDDLWWPSLEMALRSNAMPGPAAIDLRRAALGQNAVLVGAGWLALAEHAPQLLLEGGE